MLIVNSPHNPTGAVLTGAELSALAREAIAADLVVLSDEAYEHLWFDDHRHIPLATLPGMAERTLTISSGGKTFHTTGWKIGWMSGPEPLVTAAKTAKQFLTYVNGAPFQPAIAVGLGLPDTYFAGAAATLAAKRDLISAGLTAAGFGVSRPQAGYFVIAHAAPLGVTDAAEFCRALPALAGVVGVPVTAFVHEDRRDGYRSLVRFAFCKKVDLLERASAQLAELRLA